MPEPTASFRNAFIGGMAGIASGVFLILSTNKTVPEARFWGVALLVTGIGVCLFVANMVFGQKARRLRKRDRRRASLDPIHELNQCFDDLASRCLAAYQRAMKKHDLDAATVKLREAYSTSQPDVHLFEYDISQFVLIPAREHSSLDDRQPGDHACFLVAFWVTHRWNTTPYLLPGDPDEAIETLKALIEENRESIQEFHDAVEND